MTSDEMQLVVAYLVDRLDAQGKEDVKEILGGTLPDVAQDAMRKGGLALKRWPKRLLQRSAEAEQREALGQDAKPEAPKFPHAKRLKV